MRMAKREAPPFASASGGGDGAGGGAGGAMLRLRACLFVILGRGGCVRAMDDVLVSEPAKRLLLGYDSSWSGE